MKTTPKRLEELTKMSTGRIPREDISNMICDCKKHHKSQRPSDAKRLIEWIKMNTNDARVLAEIGRWE